MKINQHSRIFFAPETGGGAGAVAEEITDIESVEFALPSEQFFQEPANSPPVETKKTETKPAEVKPPAGKEKKEPVEKPKLDIGTAPADKLRARLKEVESERDDLAKKFGETSPKVAELEGRAGDLERQIADKDKSLSQWTQEKAELQKQLAVHSPELTEKVKKFDEPFNVEYSEVMEIVPELESTYSGLVSQYRRAQSLSGEEKNDAIRELREGITEKFPDDSTRVLDFVRKGARFSAERATMIEGIRKDADKTIRETKSASWSKNNDGISKSISDALKYDPTVLDTDPHNPVAALAKIVEAMPEAEGKVLTQQIGAFISTALNGAKPRGDEEYIGMDATQIAQARAQESGRVEQARAALPRLAFQGLLAIKALRGLLPELAALRDEKEKRTASNPPDPTKKKGDTNEGAQSIEDAEFDDPNKIERAIMRGGS